jgi:hypothetical protein
MMTYVCIGVGHKTNSCTATFNDLICFDVDLNYRSKHVARKSVLILK